MVADLLELGHRRQDQPAPLLVVGGGDLLQHVVHRGLVERGLLGGQVAVDLDLLLLRQVADDRLVGLQPAQDERLGGALQRGGGPLVTLCLDRDRVPLAEPVARPEQPRVGELHDRPELGEVVLHRGAGEREFTGGRNGPYGLGLPGRAVLQRLGLVTDDPAPLDGLQRVDVPQRRPIRGQHQIGLLHGLDQILIPVPAGAVMHVHLELRRELRRLPLPVPHQRHRQYGQGRGDVLEGLPLMHQECKSAYGLP